LLYSSIIAISAPIGPIVGLSIGDKFERKTVIVVTAAAVVVFGLSVNQISDGLLLIIMGVALTVASNIMSYSYHGYSRYKW
jgi:putative MFS transporter